MEHILYHIHQRNIHTSTSDTKWFLPLLLILIRCKQEVFRWHLCSAYYSRKAKCIKRGRLPQARSNHVLGWGAEFSITFLTSFRIGIRLHEKPQTRSRTSPVMKSGPLSAQITMTKQDMLECASLSQEIASNIDVVENYKRIGPINWMTLRQIWTVYHASSPIARQFVHENFVQWAMNFYDKNKRDDVLRRVQLVELVIYKAQKTCSTRDNKPLLLPHRDDKVGGDVSLVIGLSQSSDYSGCMLRIATSKDGSIWRDKKSSDARSEKLSGRAVTSYDVHLGTCVLSWNTAEHYVTRLHFGTRCVVVVHFRKVWKFDLN